MSYRLESELDSRADQMSGHRSSSSAASALDKDRDRGRDMAAVAEGPVELAELLGVALHSDSNVAHVAASSAKHFVSTVNINISSGGAAQEQGTSNPNLALSKNGNSSQMIAILSSQRDRYKERLTQVDHMHFKSLKKSSERSVWLVLVGGERCVEIAAVTGCRCCFESQSGVR